MPSQDIENIRRDYNIDALDINRVAKNPFEQFDTWFNIMLGTSLEDPTAAVLSTVDEHGYPDSRVLLLKSIENNQFVFYTNYHGAKAQQLLATPRAALNFYWPSLCRQIRIKGDVSKVSAQQSANYFAKRPRDSQLAAIASKQSQPIARASLEKRYHDVGQVYDGQEIPCPHYWGGFSLTPIEFEFWHGRECRLHDRIHYQQTDAGWDIRQLAP